MKVKDAMHKGADWVSPDMPLSEVAIKMRDLDVGSIPIGENDKLIGMITDRDIACRGVATGKDCTKLTARDAMTKGIVHCRETDDLDDALRIMEQKKLRRLAVLNDKKRLVGMLSLGDVAHSTSHALTGEMTAAVASHHP